MPQPITWSGNRSLGSRDIEPDQIRRVQQYIEANLDGKAQARHTSEICLDLAIGGRELRAATHALDGTTGSDGRPLVITSGDLGIYRARFAEEALEGTRRMEAQARRMLERVSRRQAATEDLPRLQGALL